MQTNANVTKRTGEPLYQVSNDVRASHNQDGAVLLNVRHGQMFSLNSVGSKIFQLLEAGCDEAAILAEISRTFGIEEQVVRSDLHDFIVTLTKYHLLETTESHSGETPMESATCSSNA